MKRTLLIVLTICLAFASSCSKYDDTELRDQVKDHETRIAALEAAKTAINSQISSMQTILTALQDGIQITAVTALPDGDGYTITFSKGNPITIKNGAKGADGTNGTDGITPLIGVDLFDDVYYWTVKLGDVTQWMEDAEGNKIPVTGATGANGADGADGVTPILGVDAEGYWTIQMGADAPVNYLLDANDQKIIAKVTNIPFNLAIELEGTELVFNFYELEQIIRIAVAQPFGISVSEATEDFVLYVEASKSNVYNVVMTGLTEAQYVSLRADVQGKLGNASDVNTTRAFVAIEEWDVQILGKPVFADGKATIKVKITAPTLAANDYLTSKPNANLTLTVLGKDGRTSAATYLLKMGQNQAFHIYPEDRNLSYVNGVWTYTIPRNKISSTAERITLIFDGEHQSEITVAIPNGLKLPDGSDYPIDIDFDLTENPVYLHVENEEYAGTVTLVDYYGSNYRTHHTNLLLSDLCVNLPKGSFVVGANYQINGTATVITANSSFILSRDAVIRGDLIVKGGLAKIYGRINGQTYISGENTEVYFNNHNLRGHWFKTSDIAKMSNSQFVGFNALELLRDVDLKVLVDIMNIAISSGLSEVAGVDLSQITSLLGSSSGDGIHIDLTILNNILSTDFYYAGAISYFNNDCFVYHKPEALKKVEYALHNGDNKYLATLDIANSNTPVLDAMNKYRPWLNKTADMAKKFFPNANIPSMDFANAIPTYYAAANNFSLTEIVKILSALEQLTDLLNIIDDNGIITIPLINVKISLTDVANLYKPGYIESLPKATGWLAALSLDITKQQGATNIKNALDLLIGDLAGMDMNEIGPLLGVVGENIAVIKSVIGYVSDVKKVVDDADAFINSLKAHNPWEYSVPKFTKDTKIDNFSAQFVMDCNGQGVTIDNVKNR